MILKVETGKRKEGRKRREREKTKGGEWGVRGGPVQCAVSYREGRTCGGPASWWCRALLIQDPLAPRCLTRLVAQVTPLQRPSLPLVVDAFVCAWAAGLSCFCTADVSQQSSGDECRLFWCWGKWALGCWSNRCCHTMCSVVSLCYCHSSRELLCY